METPERTVQRMWPPLLLSMAWSFDPVQISGTFGAIPPGPALDAMVDAEQSAGAPEAAMEAARALAKALEDGPALHPAVRTQLFREALEGTPAQRDALMDRVAAGPPDPAPLLAALPYELALRTPASRSDRLKALSTAYHPADTTALLLAAHTISKRIEPDAPPLAVAQRLAPVLGQARPVRFPVDAAWFRALANRPSAERKAVLAGLEDVVAPDGRATYEALVTLEDVLDDTWAQADITQLYEETLTPAEAPTESAAPSSQLVFGGFEASAYLPPAFRKDAARQQAVTRALRDLGFAAVELDDAEDTPGTRHVLLVRATDLRFEGGMVQMDLRWTLLDPVSKRKYYEAETRGFGRSPNRMDAYEAAVVDGLTPVAERPLFLEALASEPPAQREIPPTAWTDDVAIKACEVQDLQLPADTPAALKAVVVVRTDAGTGTGVMISEDGFVLTAAHVVEEVEGLQVQTVDGIRLPASLLRSDPYQDVAVLDVPGRGHACLPLSVDVPSMGADLLTVGNPMGAGLEFSLSRGIVSGLRTWAGFRFIQTDASINPGFSGGPMLTKDGRVAGILSWKITGSELEGLGFGVPGEAVTSRLGLAFAPTSSVDLEPLRGSVPDVATSEEEAVFDTFDKRSRPSERRQRERTPRRGVRLVPESSSTDPSR